MQLEMYGDAAHVYAAAFGWDNEEEAAAMAALSGVESGTVLEPMCGHARLLSGFKANGLSWR